MARGLTQHERDVLDREFPDAKVSYDRTTIEKYSKNIRGSVRLATGRYSTTVEVEERRKRVFSVKLY